MNEGNDRRRRSQRILPLVLRRLAWTALAGIALTHTPLSYYYGSPLREKSDPQRSDVIVLFSHGQLDHVWLSTVGAQRTLAALRLYKMGYAPYIVSSGSSLADGLDQAGLQASWLQLAGVPAEAIVVERKSYRTYGSVVEVLRLLKERSWRSAVIVTSELDAPRIRAAFKKQGFDNISFEQVPEFGTPSASPYYASGWPAFYHATYEYAGLMLYMWKGWI